MANAVEAKIKKALFDHLDGLVLSPTLPIAWPNINFKPPTTGYLRASHIPNQSEHYSISAGDDNTSQGLFQVDVMWPVGKGDIEPAEKAGLIVSHFKYGTKISGDGIVVEIVAPPSVSPIIGSVPFIQMPVSIRYTCETPNT